MKFSIIVPVYNVQQYLERCIKSLTSQSYYDIEIILVDDGSMDNSASICDSAADKDERIIVIHKKNGGLSDARNEGMRIAQGEYIIFVDSDDYVENNMCESFLEYTNCGVEVIIGDAIVEGSNLSLSHIISKKVMSGTEYLLEAYRQDKAPMAAWLNIYNREFLIENNLKFKKGILHEDEEFTPRALLKAQKIVCTNIPFYHYIIRENSITTKKDKRKNARDLYATFCELETIYKQIENIELRKYLLDSLSFKYLSIFQTGKLYQYGKGFIHKDFVVRNAFMPKTRLKAKLYCFSPRLYYMINALAKKIKTVR